MTDTIFAFDHVWRLQNCNLVLYNANYATSGTIAQNAIWSSGTYNGGAPPCALTVSGDNGGTITVSDAYGNVIFMRG